MWALRRRHGYEVRVIDRAGILALEPAVGPAYTVGVYLPDQAMVANPYRYCEELARALVQRGADILRDDVRAIEIDPLGLRLSNRRIAADNVVLAAGVWSGELLRPLGHRIPLKSQRGYHITLKDTGVDIRRPVVPADRKVFITPQESGLRVGGTVEFAGLDAPPNQAWADLLLADLTAVFPQARLAGPRSDWMGHRPWPARLASRDRRKPRSSRTVARFRPRPPRPHRRRRDRRCTRACHAWRAPRPGPRPLFGGALLISLA